MIKRPIDRRFKEAVLEGRKITTIRKTPWPISKPIMLFHWAYKPYRSEHKNVCAVEALSERTIFIDHSKYGKIQYFFPIPLREISGDELWKLEGFESQEAMDTWFREATKPESTTTMHLMHFRRLPEQP